MAQDIVEQFWRAPPVSRTLAAATFVESLLCHGGLLSVYKVCFIPSEIFKFPLPEVWRFLTPFILTGGGFSVVFDLYFMWTYATGLESSSPRFNQPGDFFTYVGFVATLIMCTSGFLLGNYIFTSALMLAFIYTFAQDNPGKKAHLFIINIPVEYLPWAMLTLTFIMGGWPAALSEAMGLVAAHMYDFLTRLYPTFQGGKNWIQTPTVVKRAFGAEKSAFTHKAYGTSFRPATAQPQSSSSWTSALGGSWGGRGSGRRLGGD